VPPARPPSSLLSDTLAYNRFPEYAAVDDDEAVSCGRAKTLVFIAVLVVLLARYWTFNLSQVLVAQHTLLEPSAAAYDAVVDYAPACTCRRPAPLREFVTFDLPPQANFSRNACAWVVAAYDACAAAARGDNDTAAGTLPVAPCNTRRPDGSPNAPAMVLVAAFLPAMAQMCTRLNTTLTEAVGIALDSATLGLTLLAPEDFANAVDIAIATELHRAQISATSLLQVLRSISDALAVSSVDLSFGGHGYCAYNRPYTASNFSCATALAGPPSATAYAPILSGVRFRAAFDTRPPPPEDPCALSTWSCGLPASMVGQPDSYGGSPIATLGFPLSLLNETTWVEVLRLPRRECPHTLSGPALTGYSQLFQVVQNYVLEPGAQLRVRPGILTLDYDAYFEACNPKQCVYYTEDAASWSQILFNLLQEDIGGLLEAVVLYVEVVAVAVLAVSYCRGACSGGSGRSRGAVDKLDAKHAGGLAHAREALLPRRGAGSRSDEVHHAAKPDPLHLAREASVRTRTFTAGSDADPLPPAALMSFVPRAPLPDHPLPM